MFFEEFAKLGNPDSSVSKNASKQIYLHVTKNAGELKYAATRLLRGLESHKVSIRKGSFAALSVFLGLKRLKPTELREFVQSVLVTDQQTTKKERRLVYIARILALGAILRNVPLSNLMQEESILQEILTDLVDLGQKRSTLMELATPFICHVLNDAAVNQETFDSIIWPVLLPLFSNSEVKSEEGAEEKETGKGNQAFCALHIALICSLKELKKDFELLNDIDRVAEIVLTDRVAGMEIVMELLMKHLANLDLAETFWTLFRSKIRSTHFDTVCICVEKALKAGISHNILAQEEIVAPFLGVLRNKEASDQHLKAISTLGLLLKWDLNKETAMGKKERKSIMKVMFAGVPNLLHEYQILLRILNPFLTNVCNKKDLKVLASIVEKHLDGDKSQNVRMGIVYLQFLTRLAQAKNSSADLMVSISQKMLKIGFGIEKLILGQDKKEEDEKNSNGDKEKEDIAEEEEDLRIKKSCLDSFQSILSTAYETQFIDEIFQFIIEEKDSFVQNEEIRKMIKKADKLKDKIEDLHLRYILQAYSIRLVIEQNKVLGEAKTVLEELMSICKTVSKSGVDATSEVVKFILTTASKETQPPFNYETMFNRLVIEGRITDDSVQLFADAIDVQVNDDAADEDSEEDSDEDEENEFKKENGNQVGSNEDESSEEDEAFPIPAQPKKKIVSKKSTKGDDDDSDSESLVDMDEATEQDLKDMDNALAKVFATKQKVKEEDHSELRSQMRTFRLLDSFLTRKAKSCHVSIPLMLVMPIIHALQNSIRDKKGNVLSTRIVTVLNKLNGIKKFEELDSVEAGSLFSMARDVAELMKDPKNRIINDMLGDSLIMLTKCFLLKDKKTKGESEGFLTMYIAMLDLNKDKRTKSMGVVSNIVSSALTTLPGWVKGKTQLCQRILDIIFSNDIRLFRRLQFSVVLRAVLNDKSHSLDDNEWKIKAMTQLASKASIYFSTCTKTTNTLTIELLQTIKDLSRDEKLNGNVALLVSELKGKTSLIENLAKDKNVAKVLATWNGNKSGLAGKKKIPQKRKATSSIEQLKNGNSKALKTKKQKKVK